MTDHKDHRELGYGNVDARPDIDGSTPDADSEQQPKPIKKPDTTADDNLRSHKL